MNLVINGEISTYPLGYNCDRSKATITISAKIHPMLHISTDVEYIFVPSNISGGLYQRVITCEKVLIRFIP